MFLLVENKKLHTIKKRKDFQYLFSKGFRVHQESWLTLVVLKNNLKCFRLSHTIPRFIGTAVMRNKFKRWSREFFRALEEKPHTDINVVLKKKEKDFYKNMTQQEFKQSLEKGLQKVVKKI